MCTSFSKASSDLCNNIMTMARRICTEYAYPEGLSSFTACRLIALDKNPGVCSFGVGEVVRRIIGKAVLGPLKEDVQHATGYIQLYMCRTGMWERGRNPRHERNLQQ